MCCTNDKSSKMHEEVLLFVKGVKVFDFGKYWDASTSHSFLDDIDSKSKSERLAVTDGKLCCVPK